MPSHLVVKYEQIVVKRQSNHAGQQILVRESVHIAAYKVTTGHTFAVVLVTVRAAHILSPSSHSEEKHNTYNPRALSTNVSIASMLGRVW